MIALPDVAITGATGLVGGHLLASFVADRMAVRALVRSEAAASAVVAAGAAEAVVVDLFDHDAMRDALWGIPTVYHVAGVNEACTRDAAAMYRVNVEGAVAVAEAAADAGVGRLVHTSSAAAIGEREGTVGTEHTVHDGVYLSAYARSKREGEVGVLGVGSERGLDVVVVSPSSVQGPGRSGGSARILLYALRKARPLLVDTTVSIVDIEDCTNGHRAAAERGRAGSRYLLSGASVRVHEAIALASQVVGRELEPRWVSPSVARTVGRPLAAMAAAVRPDAGVCPELVDTLLHGHRFDGSLAERELGLSYTPLRDTFERTIAWFVDQGLVTTR